MPTIVNAPRSAGGSSSRAGRIDWGAGSAPSASPRRSSKAAHPSIFGNSGAAYLANLKKSADAHRGPGVLASPFVTPLNAVLAASLIPARAVGDVIAHPSHLVSGGPSISGLGHHQSVADLYKGKAPLPSQALRGRGLLPGGKLGALTGFVADVALDPTTYLTGGLGAASHGAERVAADAVAAAAARRIDEIARTRAPTISEIARANAERAAAEATVPKTLKVGLAVPFTRGKEITLAETRAVHRLSETIGERVPQRVKDAWTETERGVATGRGIDPGVHQVERAVNRAGQHASNDINRQINRLTREIHKAARKAKIKAADASVAITRHLDDPAAHPLPAGLEAPAAHARELIDSLSEAERKIGITYKRRQNYIPHLGRTPRDREAINLWHPPPKDAANRLDKPFFINPRLTDTLDEFIAVGKRHGFEPELNISELLRRRASASIEAQKKRALDDAVTGQWGAKSPPAAVPSTAKQEARLAAAEQRFVEVMAPTTTNGLRAEAEAGRQAVKDARRQLTAARRTGDPAAVAAARDELARVAAEGKARAVAVAAEQASAALPRYAQLGQDISAAEARLPKPTAGRYALPDVPVGVPIDPAQAAGARFLGEEPIASVRTEPGRVINARARRARNAGPLGPLVKLPKSTPAQRARMSRYFTPDATMAAERQAVRANAEREVEKAIAKADRAVEKAQARLAKAQKGASKPVIRQAKGALARAEATAQQARLALERARGTYGGTNVQIAAATKGLVKSRKALTDAERKRGVVELANEVLAAKPGRSTTPEEWADLHKEWVRISGATKYHQGTLLPPEIARSLESVHKDMAKLLAEPSELVRMGRYVRNFTSRWKALALLSPGYHIRNLQDDGMRSWMAGARNPRSFVQAARILRGGENFTVRIGGKSYTADEYLRRARAYGVIDTGQVRVDIGAGRGIGTPRRGPGRGPIATASFALGESRENMTRLGTFIEMERKGMTPLAAAERVREYLFDYGEVGRLVESMRSFLTPFITYTAKAIPFAVREVGRRPGRFATIGKALTALDQASGNPDLSDLPRYMRSSFPVPLPNAVKGLLGVPSGQPMLVNPDNIFGLAQLNMLDPRLKEVEQNWSSLLNPAVQVPLEIGTGTNLFFRSRLPALAQAPGFLSWAHEHGLPVPTFVPAGKPYGYSKTGRPLIKRDSYTGQTTPGYSAYLDLLAGTLPIYGQARSATSATWRLGLARLLAGMPFTPYDQARSRYQAEKFGGG